MKNAASTLTPMLFNVGTLTKIAVGLCLALALPQWAQPQARDQVSYHNARTERVVTEAGTVQSNTLEGLSLETADGSTHKIDADKVLRISWGETPQSFQDGNSYWKRRDFENALAQFRLAASDGDARGVVRAAARMRSIECLMKLGAADSARFQEALEESQRYIEANADGRELPMAQSALGRAQWLLGQQTEAAVTLKTLFEKGQAKAAGYPTVLCLQAGMDSAWAALDAKDTGTARSQFAACLPALESALGEAAPADAPTLQGLIGTANVGEGFCLLASGDAQGARTFFDRKMNDSNLHSSGQFAATLGFGEALLAAGDAGQAQIHLARVSALDPSGRDRTARALLGLAQAFRALGTPKGESQAATLLKKIKGTYGDTPAAIQAAKLN